MKQNRRNFIKSTSLAVGGALAIPTIGMASAERGIHYLDSLNPKIKPFFDISLAEWSYHKALFAKEFTNLDFPAKAVSHGIHAVEYVSVFFDGKVEDSSYLSELKKRTDDLGVKNVLIMVDREGYLGDLDQSKRIESVENHYKWIEAAKFLGCHSIRVNAHGVGTSKEVQDAAIDGLGRLSEYGKENKINVIVENHGGYSSNGTWLTQVMKAVNNPYCGTLPDFGNFKINETEFYDQYKGVKEMMPFAKGVSAKSYDFDGKSNISTGVGNTEDHKIDFDKMMAIVKEAKYKGHIGIEFEGSNTPEPEGIELTKSVLLRLGAKK